MKAENIKWLSQFESNFKTAVNSNYSRNILESQLRKMVEIYELETGKKYSLCMHCSTAVLYFLKDMGKLYFEAVQEGLEQELKTNELEKTVTVTERNDVLQGRSSVGTITERTNTKNNTAMKTKNGKHSSRKGK